MMMVCSLTIRATDLFPMFFQKKNSTGSDSAIWQSVMSVIPQPAAKTQTIFNRLLSVILRAILQLLTTAILSMLPIYAKHLSLTAVFSTALPIRNQLLTQSFQTAFTAKAPRRRLKNQCTAFRVHIPALL